MARFWLVGLLLVWVLPVFAQTDADLQAYLDEWVAPDDPGVVLLVSDGEQTWVAAQGLADIERGIPIGTDDAFRIASITKTYVAVVALQLVDEGLLALDAPITDYVDTPIPYADEITVRQLLNMTSGIFNYTESDAFYTAVYANPTYAWTATETLGFVVGEEPYFAPGKGYYYSNSNYNLLQIIIEEADGAPLGEVLAQRIFKPLGMTNTFLEDGAALGKGMVQGYADEDGDGRLDNVTRINDGIGLGDGGIISTVADMHIFMRALVAGDLLSPDMLAEMLTTVDDGEGGLYGLGIEIIEDEELETTFLGHSGATSGFQSLLYYDTEYELIGVALTNNFDVDFFGTEFLSGALELLG